VGDREALALRLIVIEDRLETIIGYLNQRQAEAERGPTTLPMMAAPTMNRVSTTAPRKCG
jgi:hypothetical protein